MKITTKIGDGGESGLFGGGRKSKSDAVFGVLGDLDELNSVLGLCRVLAGEAVNRGAGASDEGVTMANGSGRFLEDAKNVEGRVSMRAGLGRVQEDVYRIMAVVGSEGRAAGVAKIADGDVAFLEGWMEEFADVVEGMKGFVKPGDGGELSARFHVARAVCRRAERGLVGYGENGAKVDVEILKYINRLSDLLFVLACVCEKS